MKERPVPNRLLVIGEVVERRLRWSNYNLDALLSIAAVQKLQNYLDTLRARTCFLMEEDGFVRGISPNQFMVDDEPDNTAIQ